MFTIPSTTDSPGLLPNIEELLSKNERKAGSFKGEYVCLRTVITLDPRQEDTNHIAEAGWKSRVDVDHVCRLQTKNSG